MKRSIWLFGVFLSLASAASARKKKLPKPLVSELVRPQAIAVGTDGRIYVSEMLDFEKEESRIIVVENGRSHPVCDSFSSYPSGMVAWLNWLYVTDKGQIMRIARKGKVEIFADGKHFPGGTPSLWHNS